jgi:glycosyltransferase involved in cell wall biosynthesis
MISDALSKPRISVVVPTYNRALLIGATLDAILAQTRAADEIIVVDDGSQDETSEVLARYAPRIRSLRIPNSGDLAARNRGMREASGELVAFCDSDDLWRPGFLAAMAALWQAEPATKVAYANFVILRGEDWQEEDKFSAAPAGFWDGLRPLGANLGVFEQPFVNRLIRFQPFFPSGMVADRRFLLDIGGWDEAVSRTIGTDFATALRVAEYAPFGVVQTPMVGIRKHAGNYSADVQAMNLGDADILEYVLRSRPSLGIFAIEIRASIARRRAQALEAAFVRSDFAGVRAIYALLLPADRTHRLRIKARVAMLPMPLRRAAAALLLTLGSMRSRAKAAIGP